ncbi:hypothetical protein ILUMI_08092 [Ignelater luminosus]|uniref:Uncharacterized protein n=1 Tax=Ignelater luminosus TaxID=2038154 RepID=A0A8K0D7J3_IGNLU|nr:hypothetical protein ILUMI_08092 [Ignelater luminosus]
MAALAYECNRTVKATIMDCCATSGIGIACGNRHLCLKIYFTIKLTLNLTLNVVKLKPKVFLKTSITLGGLFPEFTAKKVEVEELPSKPPTSANTPIQNRLKSKIADLTLKIKKLQDFVSTGFAKNDQKRELHHDKLKLKELTQKLNRAENLRKAQQKLRDKKKLEAPQTLPKPKRDRPPIEKEQEDGRRHVNTVPVKLIRPSNSLRKEHEDTHFCAGQIKHIRDLAKLLGPQAVNVLSVDDKARVPLGLLAAQKQAPILMLYERQILIPDHDYPIAKGLKLIPSVIGVLCFKDWKVSYSGPTCISIRGGAIDSSTAGRSLIVSSNCTVRTFGINSSIGEHRGQRHSVAGPPHSSVKILSASSEMSK